jgi:hypothetical protein
MHLIQGVKTWRYISPSVARGLGVAGQPVPQYYFHRPLKVLMGEGFAAGFVVDGLEEPVFEPPDKKDPTLSWKDFGEIPPVLVVRMRNLR